MAAVASFQYLEPTPVMSTRRVRRVEYFIDYAVLTPLLITNITVLSSTQLQVTFNQAANNDVALNDAAEYVMSPGLAVLSVQVNSSTVIVLNTAEMVQGRNYTLTVHRVDASPATLTPLTGTFVGVGIAPQLSSAIVRSNTSVRLLFNEPMATSGVQTSGTYTVTPAGGSAAVTVSSAVQDTPTSVILSLGSAMTQGTGNYTIALGAGATDSAGNPIDVAHNSVVISGAPSNASPAIADHYPLAVNRLAEQFKKKTKFLGKIRSFTNRANELEQQIANVKGYRSLTTAYGQGLDNLGQLLDVARQGLTDGNYRVRLLAMSRVQGSHGRPNELINILVALDNGYSPADISLVETIYSLESYMTCATPAGSTLLGEEYSRYLQKAKPGGARVQLQFYQKGVTLLCWDDASVVPSGSQMAEDTSPTTGGIWTDAVG